MEFFFILILNVLLTLIKNLFAFKFKYFQNVFITDRFENVLIFFKLLDVIGMCFQMIFQMFDLNAQKTY